MERPSGPPSLAQQFTFSKTPLEGDGVGGRQSSEYRDSALRSPYVPVGISGSIVITGIKHGTEPKAANKEEAPLPRSVFTEHHVSATAQSAQMAHVSCAEGDCSPKGYTNFGYDVFGYDVFLYTMHMLIPRFSTYQPSRPCSCFC
ncbi:unnamed protein product [Rangifer tarandus platyrhynchus]|uniref:Uncharacterized protein n=1 Tax=Rangifer tarandus platyrhynchus TaxID=3082113 RepID=A0AC60A1R5_RANTA